MIHLYLRREVTDMRLLPLEGGVGDEDGEVAVLHTQLLDLTVEKVLKCTYVDQYCLQLLYFKIPIQLIPTTFC